MSIPEYGFIFRVCNVNSTDVSGHKINMKKVLITTINLYLLSIGIAFGCECTKVSYRFMDRIDRYPFVAMVEVIRKDTITGQIGNPKSVAQLQGYTFTVVKIINLYSGRYSGAEIKIIDSKGFECFRRLVYKNIGDKFIVKGGIADINEYVYTGWDKPIPKEDILMLGLCDTNQLYLDKNDITGWITINSSHRWWRCNTFLKKISFGLINREKKGEKEFMPQQMKIEKFEKLLKRSIKNNL